MHDPLPPSNSTIGYTRPPPRAAVPSAVGGAPNGAQINQDMSAVEALFRSILPWSTVDPALQDPAQREPQSADAIRQMLRNAGLPEGVDQPLVLDWIRRATQNFVNNGVFDGGEEDDHGDGDGLEGDAEGDQDEDAH